MNRNDTSDYQLREREDQGDGPFEECSVCRFPAPLASFTEVVNFVSRSDGEQEWLCRLCANTFSTRDDPEIRVTICHCVNAILAALAEGKR